MGTMKRAMLLLMLPIKMAALEAMNAVVMSDMASCRGLKYSSDTDSNPCAAKAAHMSLRACGRPISLHCTMIYAYIIYR